MDIKRLCESNIITAVQTPVKLRSCLSVLLIMSVRRVSVGLRSSLPQSCAGKTCGSCLVLGALDYSPLLSQVPGLWVQSLLPPNLYKTPRIANDHQNPLKQGSTTAVRWGKSSHPAGATPAGSAD